MTNVKSGNWYKLYEGRWVHKDYVDEMLWSLNSSSTWEEGPLDVSPGDKLKVTYHLDVLYLDI